MAALFRQWHSASGFENTINPPNLRRSLGRTEAKIEIRWGTDDPSFPSPVDVNHFYRIELLSHFVVVCLIGGLSPQPSRLSSCAGDPRAAKWSPEILWLSNRHYSRTSIFLIRRWYLRIRRFKS
jgi:hypothetical protein